MKFLAEKKITIFLFFAAIILVSVVVSFYYNTKKVKLNSDLVVHTQEAIRKSNVVLLDILNIETGLRGYLLSGNKEFLQPYNEASKVINANVDELIKFIFDNPNQRPRVYSLRVAIAERIVLTKKTIDRQAQNELNDVEKIREIEEGKIYTDKIRNLITAINAEEFSLLNQRKTESARSTDFSLLILLMLLIFIAFIFVLVFIIIKNQRILNIELEAHTASQQLLSNYSLSLLEASLDPLVTINTEGKITDMNEATANITGFTRQELKGTDFFTYFTESQKAREVYEEVFAKGSVADKPLTLRHRNGNLTDVSFNGSVYKDAAGNVLGVVIVARDIAEQKWAMNLQNANKELAFQNDEKEKRAQELCVANIELAFHNDEKEKRAQELSVANIELAFQNDEKEKRAAELIVANKELLFQNDEKEKRAAELVTANKELAFQNEEKEKRAAELFIANKELLFQNDEKEKRAAELVTANKELAFQNEEKEKRAAELVTANKELAFQNEEKEKRAAELFIANKELLFQNQEKEKRAAELIVANTELLFQNQEKEKRAAELIIANEELIFQGEEKGKRAAELIIADKELLFQISEKEKQSIVNVELEAITDSLKLASQYSLSLIEASRDPLFTVSPEGKVTDMNEATVRVTGISRREIIGSDFFDYFSEPDKAREAYKEIFAKGFIVDFPLTITDGVKIDVLCNGSVYKDDKGNVLGVVIVARDITDQKRIATELSEAIVFAELAVGIAEEAKIKAESATLIAETAVKAKQQFLSNMSHEIRTPMNAIIGFTKVLLKTDTSSKQKEYLQAIKLSGDALIVLINDILDLAKVDAGKMIFERTPFKMAMSISAMLHLFEPKIREKNLELVKEYDSNIPDVLVGDPVRLHQIILNLVSNAVKFTNTGKITVSVRLLKEDEAKATIEFMVKDTGIGIAPNKMEKIFENFQQASSGTSRLYGGTGLGLAIVRQLVEAQDGSITVESKLNEGSTFGFVLDFLKTKANADIDNQLIEFDTEINDIKVLVVEDIALNQLLMRTLLDEFGFQCEVAANGKIAIEKMQSNKFDVVLMDLQMPEMNGFEATDYIRNEMKSSIPIIALTADVTTVDLAKCKEVGMNDYIAKPVDEKLLYSKIVGEYKKAMHVNGNNGQNGRNGQEIELAETKVLKYTDLHYLITRTKSNPVLMMEMISLYIEQTPPLISVMKRSWKEKDWASLYAAVHKIIPSFAIMGISVDYENMAKKVQDFAKNQQQADGIYDLVLQIDTVCTQACVELEAEYTMIKNAN
ncbi:MAG: PAS domain S-box protein [Bacteroidales bacterium]|nr:PAS domain S-box protein [Bacteroidales bacterium]